MERLGRSVQLGSVALVLVTFASARSVLAQGNQASAGNAGSSSPATASPAEIVAARELFRQGAEDADAGRFADALEKFKRVASVKETAAVRFNIARCEEALGRTGGALADFELAAREGREDPKAQDVAKLAGDRADALRPRVSRLTLFPPPQVPEGMAVSLDGSKLATATLGVGLPLDPGLHVVDATAPGRSPFHTELTLAPGQARSVTLALRPSSETSETVPPPPSGEEPKQSSSSMTLSSPPAASTQRTWGWVSIAGAGALAAASGIFLILHNNAVANVVSDVEKDCTPGTANAVHCPTGSQAPITSEESNANTDQAAAIGLVAASGVALLGGIVLVVTAPKGATSTVGLTGLGITGGAPGAPAGLTIHGSF